MNKANNLLENEKGGIDDKIIAAFERISQALRLLAWNSGKSLSLNPAQIQVLIFLLRHEHLSSKVSTLAKEFNISAASMSDSIRILEEKKLVHKVYLKLKNKNFIVHLTDNGKVLATESARYTEGLFPALEALPVRNREQLMESLTDIIANLHQRGIIPVQRMCMTCKYYDRTSERHFCHLLSRSLNPRDIQIDCPDHIKLQSYHKPFI